MTAVTVVLPVGPNRPEDFVRDTAESLTQFLPDARYVVLDNSGNGFGAKLDLPNRTMVEHSYGPGRAGLLYARQSLAYEEALREPFDVLLRIDEDAVVLGNTFVERARAMFEADPRLGWLGNHLREYNGERRLFLHSRKRLRQMLAGPEAVRDPRRALRVAELVVRARRNGYVYGEQVLGGVCVWNPLALRAIQHAGLFEDPRLIRAGMAEDGVWGLCVRACGFSMAQFGDAYDDGPVGGAWRGLPASPDELVAAGKELVHSTKSFAGRDEAEVRATFRAAREADVGPGRSPAGDFSG